MLLKKFSPTFFSPLFSYGALKLHQVLASIFNTFLTPGISSVVCGG